MIFTHPDSDHIGGAPVIITKFDVDKVFLSNFEKDNKTYQKMIQALDNKHLKYTTPKVGTQYTLGTAKITILAPNDSYDNPNDASIALTVAHGGTSSCLLVMRKKTRRRTYWQTALTFRQMFTKRGITEAGHPRRRNFLKRLIHPMQSLVVEQTTHMDIRMRRP